MGRQKQKYGDDPRHKKPGKDISPEPVKRSCLKCDQGFTARGRFNRICPNCTENNRYARFYDYGSVRRNYAPGAVGIGPSYEGESLSELVGE
jgi:hypothetical protein